METDLTGFQRDLLMALAANGSATGTDLKRFLEVEISGEEVHHGRFYPNLDTLADRGYVEKTEYDHREYEYVVTDKARQQLRERLEWEVANYDFLLDE